jgi:hypothetical protein
MNRRKKIGQIEANHNRFSSVRRRERDRVPAAPKTMHRIVSGNPVEQAMQHFPLQFPQPRLGNFDDSTSTVAFLYRLVGIVVKPRRRIVSRYTPAICKPVQLQGFHIEPRSQIAECRQLRQRDVPQPARSRSLNRRSREHTNNARTVLASPRRNKARGFSDDLRQVFGFDAVPARAKSSLDPARQSGHPVGGLAQYARHPLDHRGRIGRPGEHGVGDRVGDDLQGRLRHRAKEGGTTVNASCAA